MSRTLKRLVLFDIDGTLIWGGPLWKESFLKSISLCFPGLDLIFPAHPFGGKTDIQICRALLLSKGCTEQQTDEKISEIVKGYVTLAKELSQTRRHEVVLLPGVRETLESLSNNSTVVLGLLTGNVREGAWLKLGCVGLSHLFRFGVFGDDNWDRYLLPALAVKKAKELFGVWFLKKEIVIIGDTIHDINCGKELGARTIAVGTGRGSDEQELLLQNPDFYFKDLSKTNAVVEAILKELE